MAGTAINVPQIPFYRGMANSRNMNEEVTVREMMNREYVGVSESDDLVDTVELLLQEGATAAVVQRGNEHIGVLTERDILATLVDGPPPERATVGDVMTESVPTVDPEMTLDQVADEMSTRDAGRLVVANGSEPLGVISERDLLASRAYARGQSHDTGIDHDTTTVSGSTVSVETGTESVGEEFDDQSICEVCGRLAPGLTPVNGQLVCADCREI